LRGDPNAPIYCAVVEANVHDGKITPQLFVIDSSEEKITAGGDIDLIDEQYELRLVAHSYLLPRPHPAKALCVDLGLGLMRVMSPLAERAARLPAGPSNPDCNGGMSFTALRDAAPLPPGVSAGKFFMERLHELLAGMQALAENGDARVAQALRVLADLTKRAERTFMDTV